MFVIIDLCLDSVMALIEFDVVQTHINLHPDENLRQLSCFGLANRRIYAYHSIIAMSLLHPALLIITLFVLWRIQSMMFYAHHQHITKYSSQPSCYKFEGDLPTPSEEMVPMLCVIEVISLIIQQHLLMSGDIELNPGPLDHGINFF